MTAKDTFRRVPDGPRKLNAGGRGGGKLAASAAQAAVAARSGRHATVAVQAPIDIFLERAEGVLRFVRQAVRPVQQRQPLLKLSKHIAQVVLGDVVFFHAELVSRMRAVARSEAPRISSSPAADGKVAA